jgi:Zn-dependent protease
MTMHEAIHGLIAYLLGDHTPKAEGRLSLNPIKHIDPINTVLLPLVLLIAGLPVFGAAKPVNVNTLKIKGREYGFALVAISGPLTNLILAFIFGFIYPLVPINYQEIIMLGVSVNIGFFVFNMIPFPPLDGSRVIYPFLPQFLKDIMHRIESIGMTAIFILVLLISQTSILERIVFSLQKMILY